MTDLTQNAYVRVAHHERMERWILDTSGAQHIYKGQPMIIDQSVDTQNARGYVDATVVDPTDVCLGIAAEEKVVGAGDAETTEIDIWIAETWVGFPSAVFDNADIGKTVYMSDSAVLSETAADNPQIGKLVKVEDGFAYVLLTTPQICAGA